MSETAQRPMNETGIIEREAPEVPSFNLARRRDFFDSIGSKALGKLVPTDQDGSIVQPTPEEADDLVRACLEMYALSPSERDTLGVELTLIAAIQTLQIDPKISGEITRKKVADALHEARLLTEGPTADRSITTELARVATVGNGAALPRVGRRVKEILLDGESDVPEVPVEAIDTIDANLRNTILDLMGGEDRPVHISSRQAVGLILGFGLERYSDEVRLRHQQKTEKDIVFSTIQTTLRQQLLTFNVPMLKALVGHTDKSAKTRDELDVMIATKYGYTLADARKVVSAQLAKDIRTHYLQKDK